MVISVALGLPIPIGCNPIFRFYPMKIIHLTDIHIAKPEEHTHNVDVRKQFVSAVFDALDRGGTHLIITGDLCFSHGDPIIYEWIYEFLEEVSIPYRLIPGNHDDSKLLSTQFSLLGFYDKEEKEVYWLEYWDGTPIFFLDSSQGDLSDKQTNWLHDKLRNVEKSPLLFMHHPPIDLHVPYMDNLPPRPDTDRFFDTISVSPYRVHVFVGHYHVDKMAVYRNAIVYATPSTYFQMGQKERCFEVDHHQPGYRTIVMQKQGLTTSTHYVSHIPLRV